jgi:hypothetical protein
MSDAGTLCATSGNRAMYTPHTDRQTMITMEQTIAAVHCTNGLLAPPAGRAGQR